MKPVMQTRFGKEDGNCFDACLASLLEVPLETIPHLNEENWVDATNAWLMKEFGCYYFEFDHDEAMPFPVLGYHIMSGVSPRSEPWPRMYHSVIGYQGKMVHDPHPDGSGIKGKIRYGLIVPCDPAPDSRLRPKGQGRNLRTSLLEEGDLNPSLKLCVKCGELVGWNMHFHAYICHSCRHMERIPINGTSADATQTGLAGEQGYDSRVEATDRCESRPKGRTESGV